LCPGFILSTTCVFINHANTSKLKQSITR
jgi:hypothetical protein